jgi:thiol-disulfide isomerase/thioredoxin
VKGKLQVLKNGKLTAFDPGTRTEPQFYVIYFSAHWCGPCRRFTPNLIKTYNDLQKIPHAADKFEILFNSWDNDRSEQLT